MPIIVPSVRPASYIFENCLYNTEIQRYMRSNKHAHLRIMGWQFSKNVRRWEDNVQFGNYANAA